MRAVITVAALALCSLACELIDPAPPPANDCEAADRALLDCGVALPILTEGACVGLRAALGRCTLEHAATCDALAELSHRPELCLESLIDPPPRAPEPSAPLFPDPNDLEEEEKEGMDR